MFVVGGVHDSVALPLALCVTMIAEDGRDALAVPSETEIAMLPYVPAWVLLGVPDTWPVVVLNEAQTGLLAIVNVKVFPSGSMALGWNAYGWPAVTDVGGVPLMAGARLPVATLIEKGASEALAVPSDTEIAMLL